MSKNPAQSARRGLASTLVGKAKEVVGSVTGNDSLTAEGELQQAEVIARKEASTQEAIAHSETAGASEDLKAANAAERAQIEARAQRS
jgi:uncharacterized protein YjbJ (UPF0337 family)